MKNSSLLIFLPICLFLHGCVEPALVVGQPSAAVDSETVDIYYIDRPHCNFETIAHINVTGGYFSLQAMLRSMRREAAELGAEGLYVQHTQQINTREFLGTARAIRCVPA
jgi:hypothetical protein